MKSSCICCRACLLVLSVHKVNMPHHHATSNFMYTAEIHKENHGTIPVSFEEGESGDAIEQVR